MTTPLADRIARMIASEGPISIASFFSLCLGDPQFGYYRTRDPFGRAGDFVTAPEISQLFGEMVAVFMVQAWHAHGRPEPVSLVELGPGRATMAADMLRAAARLAPDLMPGLTVHLVETSDRLRQLQQKTLAAHGGKAAWHTRLEDVPAGFTLLVANEFFDALPIRQIVKTADGFRERLVGLDEDGALAFVAGPAKLADAELPPGAASEPEGAVAEIGPARNAVMDMIAARLCSHGGIALAIDYGHLVTGFGDTLQAIRDHVYDPPLAHPGEADLTSHVDFEDLAKAARAGGAHVSGAMTQGDFLVGLGLLERAGTLGAGKDPATQETIREAVERLAAPGQGRMGELFKVLAVSSRPVALPPFRSAD